MSLLTMCLKSDWFTFIIIPPNCLLILYALSKYECCVIYQYTWYICSVYSFEHYFSIEFSVFSCSLEPGLSSRVYENQLQNSLCIKTKGICLLIVPSNTNNWGALFYSIYGSRLLSSSSPLISLLKPER